MSISSYLNHFDKYICINYSKCRHNNFFNVSPPGVSPLVNNFFNVLPQLFQQSRDIYFQVSTRGWALAELVDLFLEKIKWT